MYGLTFLSSEIDSYKSARTTYEELIETTKDDPLQSCLPLVVLQQVWSVLDLTWRCGRAGETLKRVRRITGILYFVAGLFCVLFGLLHPGTLFPSFQLRLN